ncbi:M15 family metallopeptidase [Anaerosolibacter carboniphilus]|nr:M15 family metallopeptidase [Anaerosolibacter carboniphilus]
MILGGVLVLVNHFDTDDYVKNPEHIQVLVNRENQLSPDYVPEDLVTPQIRYTFDEDSPKRKVRREVAEALEEMFTAAEQEGITLYATSGYRSYERQKQIYQERVSALGIQAASAYVAPPGCSEHQTGLAMDIGNQLTEEFGNSKEGKWLEKNAFKYGFIIRYPKGKEHITGISYEPWHIRYVGDEAAVEIASQGITLEEFVGADPVGRHSGDVNQRISIQIQHFLGMILNRFATFTSENN